MHDIGVRSVFGMGRKFKLSVHRKNEERKKYAVASLPVSIPLEKVSVYKISIPLSFKVTLPISVYVSAPAPSIEHLKSRLEIAHTLPQGTILVFAIRHFVLHSSCIPYNVIEWSITIEGVDSDASVERTSLTLFNHRRHPSSEVPCVFYALKVFNDFSWAVYVGNKMVCVLVVYFISSKLC